MFKRTKDSKINIDKKTIKQDQEQGDPQSIPASISQCHEILKETFSNSTDVVIEPFFTYKEEAMIVYIDGLVNKDLMDRDILSLLKSKDFNGDIALSIHSHCKEKKNLEEVLQDIVGGNIALFYENLKKAVVVDFKSYEKRSVEAPDAESFNRGPREGFTESIRTNTSLLRRKIKNPKLEEDDSLNEQL